MATYTIVDKDKDPLGANEIRAGDTIDVNNGDVFIVSASANDNVKFESATGSPANFEIRFETSNANDFDVEIMENLDVGIVISNGADLSDIDIKADKALSVNMTAGDDVSLGKFEGSKDGVDVLTIGNGFTTDHDIKLSGGDNFLSIGDDATIRKIETGDGDDSITIGDGLTADDIKTGEGDDSITIGDGATLDNHPVDRFNTCARSRRARAGPDRGGCSWQCASSLGIPATPHAVVRMGNGNPFRCRRGAGPGQVSCRSRRYQDG